MILHRMADHIGDLDEAPVIFLMQGPEDAPLHRLQAVSQIWNRAVADDVAGIIKKPAVHPHMQPATQFLRVKRLVGNGFHHLGYDMLRGGTAGGMRGHRHGWHRVGDGHFGLLGFGFFLGCAHGRRALSHN